ncbi:MAG: hypothetical protein A3I61_03785 [Acidobacteria bacterium RIFCSPLOWO2_02_FULL_68_18]|nr:MAG: hypothetical protein A3I61_03785 [Acidobacteria bacterium RIFCSPLOWO2_02_FULL_68_18]OFW52164.1 MAG: hypothetical protein A3G77_08090 [Acidobacteria bacterium RIFCSPLOWO2_12_FULL_68_19]
MSTEGRFAAKNSHRDQPAYGLAEAARYLKLPPATLRAWTFGRPYPTASGEGHFPPLIRPASSRPPLLSFSNLIEAHVLRALRTEHGVSVKAVRDAARFAERKLQINRLLLSQELRTKAGDIFLDRYGELINLSASGQLAMRHVLDAHLRRVVWEHKLPIRLYPFVSGQPADATMPIAIDPRIAFGRPVVASRGVSTAAIVARIDAGEPLPEVAADYELSQEEVEHAVLYERAA